MNTKTLRFDVSAPIGTITLNQPEKRNAICQDMWVALGEALCLAEKDSSVKSLIIRGEGDHFAAGADISEFADIYANRQSTEQYTNLMLAALDKLETFPKPTIAAIRGACVGGGCSIALACDFRFASSSARFGITPSKLGLVYSLADTRRLVQAVGMSAAKDILFTARIMDSQEALHIKLCDRLFDDQKFDDEIIAYAKILAARSQTSLRATKEIFQYLQEGYQDMAPEVMTLMLDIFEGADFKEGYKAFLEKRKPDFPTQ